MPMPVEQYNELIKDIEKEKIPGYELENALTSGLYDNLTEEQTIKLYVSILKTNRYLYPVIKGLSKNEAKLNRTLLKEDPFFVFIIGQDCLTSDMWHVVLAKIPQLLTFVPAHFFDPSQSANLPILELVPQIIEDARLNNRLDHIPEHYRDNEELCLEIIQNDFMQIKYVPLSVLSSASFMANDAVQLALQRLREAVSKDWKLIEYSNLPAIIIDESTAIAAANQNWQALNYIPKTIFTSNPQGFTQAIEAFIKYLEEKSSKGNYNSREALNEIPLHCRTLEVCLKGLELHYQAFRYFPKEICNSNFVNRCRKNSFFGRYILTELGDYAKTTMLTDNEYEQICLDVLQKEIDQFANIPYVYRNLSLCLKLADNLNPKFLSFIQDYSHNAKLSLEEYRQVVLTSISKQITAVDSPFLASLNRQVLDSDLWLALLKKDGLALQYLSLYGPADLRAEELAMLQQSAVTTNGEALSFIEPEKRSYAICWHAINNNPKVISYLFDYQKSGLKEKEFMTLCSVAVSKDDEAILSIPFQFRDFNLWEKAINRNGLKLKELIEFYEGGNPTKITENQFKQLCLKAITTDAEAFQYLPKKYRDYTSLKWIVEQNSDAIKTIYQKSTETSLEQNQLNELVNIAYNADRAHFQYLPSEKQTSWEYAATLSADGMLLQMCMQTAGWGLLEKNQQEELMVLAVKTSPMSLQFVNSIDRAQIINLASAQELLRTDYNCLQFFPNLDYEAEKNKVLNNVEYLVVTTGYYSDREVADSVRIYSAHPKRKGKVLHYSTSQNLKDLLNELEQKNEGGSLNLVLLGHANTHSQDICNLTPTNIANLLLTHDRITRVTLFGCHTANAKKQDREFDETQDALIRFPIPTNPCGMLVMNTIPSQDRYGNLLNAVKSDKEGNKAEEALILIRAEEPHRSQPLLIYIQQKDQNIITHTLELDKNQYKRLGQLLGDKKKDFPYPRSKKLGSDYSIHKGGKTASYLTREQIEKLDILLRLNLTLLTQDNSTYAQVKSKYPFFRQEKIDSKEAHRLLPSLQKKVIEAIENEPKFKRSIEVKGYSHVMSVDFKEKRMKAGSISYSSAYQKARKPSKFFDRKQDNIDREALDKFYQNQLSKKQASNSSGDDNSEDKSSYKSITYTMPKKP